MTKQNFSYELPIAFAESREFSELSDAQARAFRQRLKGIDHVADDILSSLKEATSLAARKDAFDNAELDIATQLNASSEGSNISNWLVHSSWTFEIDEIMMLDKLTPTIVDLINCPIPSLLDSHSCCESWLPKQAVGMQNCLTAFYKSETFLTSISNLIALNVVLAKTLAGLYISRFTYVVV